MVATPLINVATTPAPASVSTLSKIFRAGVRGADGRGDDEFSSGGYARIAELLVSFEAFANRAHAELSRCAIDEIRHSLVASITDEEV